jgi:hypothetical protein
MPAKQLTTCAARLPEPERSPFLEAHRRAAELIREAVALRRAAWARYREILNCPKGEPHKRRSRSVDSNNAA